MTVTTYNALTGSDGAAYGNGTYALQVTEDVTNAGAANERRTLLHVVVDGTNRQLPTNYRVVAGNVVIDSSKVPVDPNFPPCPAGQTLRLPQGTTDWNVRIDNIDYSYNLW